jgi:hypothetical protein
MATEMKRAPAKVVPMALMNLLVLKDGLRRGVVPTIITMATNRTMKHILRMVKTVLVYIVLLIFNK